MSPGPFDYDARAPLEWEERSVETVDGIDVHDVAYASPKGGRVPAYLLVRPGGTKKAGVVFMHWGQGNRSEFLAEGLACARAAASEMKRSRRANWNSRRVGAARPTKRSGSMGPMTAA